MSDLESKGLIVAKGVLFLCIALLAAAGLLLAAPSWQNALLLLLLAWASARFYYFLFYVLERYVDARYRYAGVIALVRAILARRNRRP